MMHHVIIVTMLSRYDVQLNDVRYMAHLYDVCFNKILFTVIIQADRGYSNGTEEEIYKKNEVMVLLEKFKVISQCSHVTKMTMISNR